MPINAVFRILIGVGIILITGYVSFFQTPELDEVKNKGWYRMAYFSFITRGLFWMAFDVLNLFPI